jgi:ribose transport system substrate-binding protein
MTRRTVGWFSALALTAAIACAAAAGTAGSTTQGHGAQKTLVIGWSAPIAANEFFQAVLHGETEAAKQLGFTVQTYDANLSPDKQVSDIDAMVTKKVAGMISWTLNPGAAEGAYKRAADAGITIVGMSSKSAYFTATVWDPPAHDCRQSRLGASYIARRVAGAKVIVIGGPPVPSITQLTNCFIKSAKTAGLKVIAHQDNLKDQAASAQSIVQDLLTKHPDTQAIWCYNDSSCVGAGAVAHSSNTKVWVEGKQKGMLIVGNDGNPAGISAIKQGVMSATYDEFPEQQGRVAVQLISMKLKGAKVPRNVVIPSKLWDATNIASYVRQDKRPIKVGPLPK